MHSLAAMAKAHAAAGVVFPPFCAGEWREIYQKALRPDRRTAFCTLRPNLAIFRALPRHFAFERPKCRPLAAFPPRAALSQTYFGRILAPCNLSSTPLLV